MSNIDFDKLHNEIISETKDLFVYHENISLYNTQKVLDAFRNNQVSDYYFNPSSGYGYADKGRYSLDKIYAEVFGAQAALVRSQFVSGTHAIATALLAILKKDDELIAVTGTPYDTLQTVIGANVKQPNSLIDLGINYSEVPLTKEGLVDLVAIQKAITPKTKVAHIQRSRGYASRKSLSINEIKEICKVIKAQNNNCICFVDNCYGEFVEKLEPTQVGADIIAGSLIKNPGGGIAPSGGYIVGRKDLVELASFQFTAPGLGSHMGATHGDINRLLFQGFFLAPHITLQAVKTVIYASFLFEKLGYKVSPSKHELRSDIILSIDLNKESSLIEFCQAIQYYSPVDAHVVLLPGYMPGYQDQVIMAAGTFIQGASIELSADGPLRAPYTVFLQGGLTFEHSVIALLSAAKKIYS